MHVLITLDNKHRVIIKAYNSRKEAYASNQWKDIRDDENYGIIVLLDLEDGINKNLALETIRYYHPKQDPYELLQGAIAELEASAC